MSKEKVSLLMTGDIMPGGEFLRLREERNLDWAYPFKQVKPLFEEPDIVFGNLECPLSNNGPARIDKDMALYAPPDSVSALKYLNYSVVSLGNNHINDYGEKGLVKTTEMLVDAGIPFFGAGRNLAEASREVIIEKNGLKTSFLGYTTSEEHVSSIIADANTAGCAPYEAAGIENDIDRVRNKSDIICISLHWGYELYAYPSPEQVELAHRIIDAGANIIIGHHPHMVQGFERYRQGLILYSLGNFFFTDFYSKSGDLHKWSRESNEFIIVRCEISKTRVGKVKILPGFRNADYQVVILDGEDREKSILKLEGLSQAIKSQDYRSFWNSYSKKRGQKLIRTQLWKLPQRVKELGFRGCLSKLSIETINYIGGLVIKYARGLMSFRKGS